MRGDVNDSSYIRTYTGGYFWPLEPRAEDVRLEDIAHALGNQCRWTGHVKSFYSVGQHCVLASRYVSHENALKALLHDASEAYLADLARPIKHAPGLGETYRQVETKLEKAIWEHFKLDGPVPSEMSSEHELKQIDNALLWTEKRDLMEGDWEERLAGEERLLPITLETWSPFYAEILFLQRFDELTNGK